VSTTESAEKKRKEIFVFSAVDALNYYQKETAMLKKIILLLIILIPPTLALSCVMDKVTCLPVLPPVIALRIAVENKLETSVQLRIRHIYSSERSDYPATYSDWSMAELPAATTRTLGDEIASYRYENEDREMVGFILLDSFIDVTKDDVRSSFEIEIQTEDKTICLAGYKTGTSEFTETELGDLKIERIAFPGGQAAWMYFKNKHFLVTIPFLLQARLSIRADGTCTFEYDNGDWQGQS
jgi:hypothetical protein